MASSQSGRSGSIVVTEESQQPQQQQQGPGSPAASSSSSPNPSVTVKLRKARNRLEKKVSWTEDTVDNEGLGKKKSKCCCVYQKPVKNDPEEDNSSSDSSSDESDDGECEHCSGHVEKSKSKQKSSPTQQQPPLKE